MAELPAYKPSGQGGSVDLKNILTSQMLSWGAFKHQFKSKYKSVAGTTWIEGREVFKAIDIRYSLRNKSSETYEFMKFIGFTDKDLTKLVEDLDNPDAKVKTATLGYKVNQDYEESDFEAYWNFYRDESFKFDTLSITMDNVSYVKGKLNEASRGSRSFGLKYSTEEWTEGNDWGKKPEVYTEIKELSQIGGLQLLTIGTLPRLDMLSESMICKAYKNGANVTQSIDAGMLKWFALLSILEPSMMPIQRTSVRKKYFQKDIDDGYGGVTWQNWVKVLTTEYIAISNINYFEMKKKHLLYTDLYSNRHKCKDQTQEECESRVLPKSFSKHFWISIQKYIISDTETITDGLFFSPKGTDCSRPENLWSPECRYQYDEYEKPLPPMYLKVDGIDECHPDIFGYFISQFMNIGTTVDKGGWFKRFIGGLIKAILSLIGAILEIFLKIPGLKQMTEILLKVIGAIFNVDGAGAKEIFKQIVLAIILIVIAFFIGPLVGALFQSLGTGAAAAAGTGVAATVAANLGFAMTPALSTLITYSSYAMQIYSAGMQGKAIGQAKEYAMDTANRNYRMRKAQDAMHKVKEAFGGTMGTAAEHESRDNMMYNIMFNPFYFHPQAIPAEEMPQSGIQ